MLGLPGPALRFHGKKTDVRRHRDPARRLRPHRGHGARSRGPAARPALGASLARGTTTPPSSHATRHRRRPAETLLVTLADWDAIDAVEDDDATPTSRNARRRGRRPGRAARPRAHSHLPRTAHVEAHLGPRGGRGGEPARGDPGLRDRAHRLFGYRRSRSLGRESNRRLRRRSGGHHARVTSIVSHRRQELGDWRRCS